MKLANISVYVSGIFFVRRNISMWQTFAVYILIVLVIYLIIATPCDRKSSFRNKSQLGYYYDTDTLSFITKNDLNIGVKELIRIFKEDGREFTAEQLIKLPHYVIINILEGDDDNDIMNRKAKLVVMLDPTYGQALLVSRMPADKIYAAERDVLFNILKKYFDVLRTPINRPIADWSNKLLIKTFHTWIMPKPEEFQKS